MERQINNNHTQALNQAISDNNVIILGGDCGRRGEHVLNTVEQYNITTGQSTLVTRMNISRSGATSCVYNGDVMVVGGYDGHNGTDTIEIPLQSTLFAGKLLCKLSDHAAVCHDGKLYVIGGHNWSEGKMSDATHEILLTTPYTCTLLI